jgi:hypothetical protein
MMEMMKMMGMVEKMWMMADKPEKAPNNVRPGTHYLGDERVLLSFTVLPMQAVFDL